MVGGETRHSVEVARLLAYAAGNADEGIIGPRDLEVRAPANPGPFVDTYPGVAFILNKAPGGEYQSYAARWPLLTRVDVSPTGAGGGRSDLIVARIENPYENNSPWPLPDPAVKAAGDAIMRRIALISGVDANTRTVPANLGYSAIPLALITLPASTTNVLQTHIRDLRRLNNIRSDSDDTIRSNYVSTVALTSATMVDWPAYTTMDVYVPPWATEAIVRADLSGIAYGASGINSPNVWGTLRLMLGTVLTQETSYNVSTEAGADTTTLLAGDRIAIPAAIRGTTQTLRIQGRKSGGNTSLTQNTGTTCALSIQWRQKPESNA